MIYRNCYFWILLVVLFYSNPVFAAANDTYFVQSDTSIDERLLKSKLLLEKGNQKEAIQLLYEVLDEAKKNNNISLLIETNFILADVYRDNGDYKKSNNFLNANLFLERKNTKSLVQLFFKKGGNFQLDNQVDSALVNYQKSIFLSNLLEDNFDLKAKVNANISGIYYLKENYTKAIEHSKIAADFQRIIGNKEIEAGILNNLGSIYYMLGNYSEALLTFEKALSLVGFGQTELQKKARNSSYINIAYAYSGLGNFEKAFEFQDKYFSLNDSLSQELKYKEIAEIESKYKVASKVKEAELERVKRKEAEFLMYAFGLGLLLLLGGFYILYKLYFLNKKNYALEIEQRKLIHQTKLERIKNETQSKILSATLDGRLEERKKIASVLHDNISALLSAANLHLYASKKQITGNIPPEIDKSQSILKEASEQIRDLSHDLVSAILLKFGLAIATQDLCEKSSNVEIVFEMEAVDIERFDQNFEMKIFNIINELVNNILKHSNASKAVIELKNMNQVLHVNIKDNGRGFDVQNLPKASGIGLSQIEASVLSLSGTLQINSSSTGTITLISVPIKN